VCCGPAPQGCREAEGTLRASLMDALPLQTPEDKAPEHQQQHRVDATLDTLMDPIGTQQALPEDLQPGHDGLGARDTRGASRPSLRSSCHGPCRRHNRTVSSVDRGLDARHGPPGAGAHIHSTAASWRGSGESGRANTQLLPHKQESRFQSVIWGQPIVVLGSCPRVCSA
jgi:hypothetical protein